MENTQNTTGKEKLKQLWFPTFPSFRIAAYLESGHLFLKINDKDYFWFCAVTFGLNLIGFSGICACMILHTMTDWNKCPHFSLDQSRIPRIPSIIQYYMHGIITNVVLWYPTVIDLTFYFCCIEMLVKHNMEYNNKMCCKLSMLRTLSSSPSPIPHPCFLVPFPSLPCSLPFHDFCPNCQNIAVVKFGGNILFFFYNGDMLIPKPMYYYHMNILK